MADHPITRDDLATARKAFQVNEPRGLFYRAATEIIRLARCGLIDLRMEEAVAVLLQTWNRSFYRFEKTNFDEKHFADIATLLSGNRQRLDEYRDRRIEELKPGDKPNVVALFKEFAAVLGSVGAAKTFHLLAHRFLPLWDQKIAAGYGCSPAAGRSGGAYWKFMEKVRDQCRALCPEGGPEDLLKRIDECNYCRYTLLAATDELYDKKGQRPDDKGRRAKAKAVRKYESLYPLATEAAKSRVLARIVDFHVEQGDTAAVRKWVERGRNDKVPAMYRTAECSAPPTRIVSAVKS